MPTLIEIIRSYNGSSEKADEYAKKINDEYKKNPNLLDEKFLDFSLDDYHILTSIINRSTHTEGSILPTLALIMKEAIRTREAQEMDEIHREAASLITVEDIEKAAKEIVTAPAVTPEIEKAHRNLTDMTQYYLEHLEARLKSLGKRTETTSKVVGGFGGGGVVKIPGNAVHYDALVENIKVIKRLRACLADKGGKNKAEQLVDFAAELHATNNNKFPSFLKANWASFSNKSAGYIDAALGTKAKKLISTATDGMWKQAPEKAKNPEIKIVYQRSHKKKY